MLMTKEPKALTRHAFKLLECLRNARGLTHSWIREQPDNVVLPFDDNWLSRSMIAWCMGKNRLTPYDLALLELLEEHGYAESRQLSGLSTLGMWIYRSKNP